MSKRILFVSATIVLILPLTGWASPPEQIPPEVESEDRDANPQPLDENAAISPAPGVKRLPPPANSRYYPYLQALSFRTGRISDFPKLDLEDSVTGFQYLFPKFLAPKLEAGADLIEGGKGHIHAGVRYIAWERSYFRPSGKIGLDHLMESKEGLATFTRHENYYVRTSAILEYTVWNPASLRSDMELLFNFRHTRFELTLGVSWGW